MMLVWLNKWALRLSPLYNGSLIAAAVGALASAGLLLSLDNRRALGIRLCLLFTMWALMLFVFLNLFKTPVPLMLPALPWRERMQQRLQYGLMHVLAFGYLLLFLVVCSLSLKLLVIA